MCAYSDEYEIEILLFKICLAKKFIVLTKTLYIWCPVLMFALKNFFTDSKNSWLNNNKDFNICFSATSLSDYTSFSLYLS